MGASLIGGSKTGKRPKPLPRAGRIVQEDVALLDSHILKIGIGDDRIRIVPIPRVCDPLGGEGVVAATATVAQWPQMRMVESTPPS